jgi:hypothetical protein
MSDPVSLIASIEWEGRNWAHSCFFPGGSSDKLTTLDSNDSLCDQVISDCLLVQNYKQNHVRLRCDALQFFLKIIWSKLGKKYVICICA